MPAHTASSTHWPSWSQAPSWWGSPKSPTAMGPSTADTISPRVICAGLPGEDVAAADAPLRAHDAGALEGQQDLLEVGLGEARCARRCRARRWGPTPRRAARATAAPGSRSHPASRPSRRRTVGRDGRRRRSLRDGGEQAQVVVDPCHRAEPMSDDPLLPDYDGACITNVVPALLHLARRCRRRGCLPSRSRPSGSCSSSSTASAGTSSRTRRHLAPTLAALDGGPITTVAPSPPPPRSRRSAPGCRPVSTASWATGSRCDGEVLNVLRWTTAAGRRPPTHRRRPKLQRTPPSAGSGRRWSHGPSSPRPASRWPTSTRCASPGTAPSAP